MYDAGRVEKRLPASAAYATATMINGGEQVWYKPPVLTSYNILLTALRLPG
jgi:hypothetical protein